MPSRMNSGTGSRGRALALAALCPLLAACIAPRTTFVCKDRNALVIDLGGRNEPEADLEWAELIDVDRGMIVWRVDARPRMSLTSVEFSPEQRADAPPRVRRGAFEVASPAAGILRLAPERRYEFLAKGSWWESAARVRFRLERCLSATTPGASVEVP